MAKDQYDCGIVDTIETIFGHHNLTSDAEGEDEFLAISRNKVCWRFQFGKDMYNGDEKEYWTGYVQSIYDLFGSKCLPDVPSSDAHEDNFATKEPKPAEPEEPTCTDTCTDDCPSQSRDLSQETANCDKCNDLRPHIAAMMAQAILTRIDDIPQVIAEAAFRHADSLIAESKKRRSDGNL